MTLNGKLLNLERLQHYFVSSIGGFFGAFALLNHHETFGSSQTSNMICLVTSILGNNVTAVLIRLFAVLIYVLGFVVSIYVSKRTKLDKQLFSLLVDAICMISLYFIPSNVNDIIALYPIFFAMAIQWSTFSKADGYTSSTIFSTNNLKQATTSMVEYFMDKDFKKLDKSKFYFGTLLGFHLGVVISFISHYFFSSNQIWFCALPILSSTFIWYIRLKLDDKSKEYNLLKV